MESLFSNVKLAPIDRVAELRAKLKDADDDRRACSNIYGWDSESYHLADLYFREVLAAYHAEIAANLR